VSKADRRTWVFQANPSKYDIYASLAVEAEEWWNCNQHASVIGADDRVLVWISGKEDGIYAVGTVLSNPVPISDSPRGLTYWYDKRAGRMPKHRARVRYDEVLLDRPVLRSLLVCDPQLWDMRIISQPRGTNFAVTTDEWAALEWWLSS